MGKASPRVQIRITRRLRGGALEYITRKGYDFQWSADGGMTNVREIDRKGRPLWIRGFRRLIDIEWVLLDPSRAKPDHVHLSEPTKPKRRQSVPHEFPYDDVEQNGINVLRPGVDTVLEDRRGARWFRAPEYQEDRPGEPGYMVLVSNRGEKEIYEWVVERFGFRDERLDGRPYLIGYIYRARGAQ